MTKPKWLQLAGQVRQARAQSKPQRGEMLRFESETAGTLGLTRSTLRSYSNALDALDYLIEVIGSDIAELENYPPSALRTLARWHKRAPDEAIGFLASGRGRSARAVRAAESESRKLAQQSAEVWDSDIIRDQIKAAPGDFQWRLINEVSLHLSSGRTSRLYLPFESLRFGKPVDRWARYSSIAREAWLDCDQDTQNEWRSAAHAAHNETKVPLAVLEPIRSDLPELYNNRAREIWSRALSAAQTHWIVIVPLDSLEGLYRVSSAIPSPPVQITSISRPDGANFSGSTENGELREPWRHLRRLPAGGLVVFAHGRSILQDLFGFRR